MSGKKRLTYFNIYVYANACVSVYRIYIYIKSDKKFNHFSFSSHLPKYGVMLYAQQTICSSVFFQGFWIFFPHSFRLPSPFSSSTHFCKPKSEQTKEEECYAKKGSCDNSKQTTFSIDTEKFRGNDWNSVKEKREHCMAQCGMFWQKKWKTL